MLLGISSRMIMPVEEIVTAKYAFVFADQGIALSFVFVIVINFHKEFTRYSEPKTILSEPKIAHFN